MKKFYSGVLFLIAFLASDNSFAQLTAIFTADHTSSCGAVTVTFTDQSTGNPNTWHWDFGNGNTSNNPPPVSANYSLPGTYNVTLTVSNGVTSNTSAPLQIHVYAPPAASFNINPDSACVGSPVTFTSTSTNGTGVINHWRWTFGDGFVIDSTAGIVTHAYTFSQQFPVSLVVTDVNGCTSASSGSVQIINGPLAAFSASPVSSCSAPLTVTFNNLTNPPGTTYLWHFGDGGTSTSVSPTVTHTYASNGTYTVSLDASTPACQNTLTQNNYIVIQSTTAAITTNTSICLGDTAFFTDATVPSSTSRTWNFGDPTSGVNNFSSLANPSHVYLFPNTYTVRLISTANGCTDTVTQTITVHPLPSISFSASDSAGCNSPFPVTFADHTAGAASWLWNFGGGNTSVLQNPTFVYTTNGFYDVGLTVTDSFGCTNSLTHFNYIQLNPPVANFVSTPDSGCVPLTVSFTSTSSSNDPIATYHWYLGNRDTTTTTATTITNIYSAVGIYSVSLAIVTTNGCTDSVSFVDLIKVGTPPTADFTWQPDTICFGQSITFTDQSSSDVDAWLWSFGDGGASTQQNPSYQYTDTGLFSVQLIAFYNGCSDTVVYPNIIRVLPPKPEFSYTLSCSNPFRVTFQDQSAGADSIVWDFGDGTVDTTNNPSPIHVYSTRGLKVVTLVAFNDSTGCSYAKIHSFQITVPIARFNQQPVRNCYPLTVNFADSSQDANTYSWNFGDPLSGINNTSIAVNPFHTYNQPGIYTVTLIIFDIHGCSDTLIKQNIIHAVGPVPDFNVNVFTGCVPLSVLFTDISTPHEGPIITRQWNFGDGTVITTAAASVSHVYTVPGNDTVTLTVTDTNGCVKSITRPAFIRPTYPFPTLSFNHYACPNQAVIFSDSGTVAVNPISNWNFGDGGTFTSTGDSAVHSYSTTGNYVVSVRVVDINGCDSTVSDTIHVISPTANFNISSVNFFCDNTQVSFHDLSTSQITGWHWSFGDGGISVLQNPVYTYVIPGYYNVSLTATNIAGCSATKTIDSIVVVPGTTGSISFAPDSGCHPLDVTFNGTASTFGIDPDSLFYTWDFGDGQVAFQQQFGSAQHTYTIDGDFRPTLIIGFNLPNGSQCFDTTQATGLVHVHTDVNVNVTPHVITFTEGAQVPLFSSVTDPTGGPPFTYSWTPPQTVTCSTCENTTVISNLPQDTSFYVLTVTDNRGCQGYDSVRVIYVACESQLIIPNVFTPNDDGSNDTYYIEHFCPGDFHFWIYNRWGKLIYESSDPLFQWDGKMSNGNEASDGTYYYVCNTTKQELHGFLQLIRK